MRTICQSVRRSIVLGATTALVFAAGNALTARSHRTAPVSHTSKYFSTADHTVSPNLHGNAPQRTRYGRLPLHFEANHGQSDSEVRFLARGGGCNLLLTTSEVILVLSQPAGDESRKVSLEALKAVSATEDKNTVVRMTLVNANLPLRVEGRDKLPGKSHYLIGNDPAKWRTNIPTYARVKYEGVYPGVDVVYYGDQGHLEYDFILAPRVDPDLITLAFDGAREIHIDSGGALVLGVEGGEVRQHKPVVYQEVAGVKRMMAGRYVMKGKRQVGFQVADYDPSRPLIIDPVLVYSTYLGSSAADFGFAIAVDQTGSAYVTGSGRVSAADSPASGADVFVAKLDASGSALVYSTYLGGSGSDISDGIAVDREGSVYVTGGTTSTDFPSTSGAAQEAYGGGNGDVFVTKLDASGSGLVYSTYLGGTGGELGKSIALDSANSAYVTGVTLSPDFPTTAGAAQTTYGGGFVDSFVTKLNATGSVLAYSTYLGGSEYEEAWGIAVDRVGSAFVTGMTGSLDFPTTAGVTQPTYAGEDDAFVTKLDARGSGLVYSTYLGGASYFDVGLGIAVDGTGNAYVTGSTGSADFPTTTGAYQTTFAGGETAFVTRLNAAASGLVYSTYLGAASSGWGIAVDDATSVYIAGQTSSSSFPTTAGAIQTTLAGSADLFVTKLHPAGSSLVYSTYLGGDDIEVSSGLAIDEAGGAYVTGYTDSINFPTTPGAAQATPGGSRDAFVAKIATPPLSIDECKHGGWAAFGVFRNQGDCVSFVVTRGKNPPSAP